MTAKIFNLSAQKQRVAWLALCAMALIIIAPLVSTSLQQSPMGAMAGMHHEMSMSMPVHHSMPESMPVGHSEACGYCVLLIHVPGLMLALCVLLCAMLLRVAAPPLPLLITHWRYFPWLFPDTRAPPSLSALSA